MFYQKANYVAGSTYDPSSLPFESYGVTLLCFPSAPNLKNFTLCAIDTISYLVYYTLCFDYFSDIEAECQDDYMKIRIGFNGSFGGLLYSSGYSYDPDCVYINGTGRDYYEFYIQLNRCGTLGKNSRQEDARKNPAVSDFIRYAHVGTTVFLNMDIVKLEKKNSAVLGCF